MKKLISQKRLIPLLLLVFVSLANGCGTSIHPSQEEAVRAIERYGTVILDKSGKVKTVILGNSHGTTKGLVHLSKLSSVQNLFLTSGFQLTDNDLSHLKGLTNLQYLNLSNSEITDAGLVHLKVLQNLEWLNLCGTKVTDAGLAHLKRMTRLKGLVLFDTKVTDDGVKELQAALPKCDISWK